MTDSNFDLIEAISSDMALETPQIKTEWTFKDEIPELISLNLRRSTYRFPETQLEGESVFNEAFDRDNPKVNHGDAGVEADKVYYYSLFATHYGPYAMDREWERDIERLGQIAGCAFDQIFVKNELLGTGDGSETDFSLQTEFTTIVPFSFTLTADDGTALEVTDDGDGGLIGDSGGSSANEVNYSNGLVDVGFDNPLLDSSLITANYQYFGSGVWILAKDQQGNRVLWLYNTNTKLVEKRYSLDEFLEDAESLVALISVSMTESGHRVLTLVTHHRVLTLLLSPDEVLTQAFAATMDALLSPGFEITGATLDRLSAGGTQPVLRVLDAANKQAVRFTAAVDAVDSIMDLSGVLGETDHLRGLFYDHVFHELFVGNDKTYISFDSDDTAPTQATGLYPVRQRITANPYLMISSVLHPDEALGLLELYQRGFTDSQFQIEQRGIPQLRVVGLWHLDETSGDALDFSGNGSDGSLNGNVTQGAAGRFGEAIQIEGVDGYVDISGVGTFWGETEGAISFWYKLPYAGYVPVFTSDRYLFRLFVDADNRIEMFFTTTGELKVEMVFDGDPLIEVTLADASDYFSANAFTNITLTWISGFQQLYFDSVLVADETSVISGFTGVPTVSIGDFDGTDSALGYYDDFSFNSGFMEPWARYGMTTKGNRSYALAGRDYDDTEAFSFRNEYKKYFTNLFLDANDANPEYLPDGVVAEDGQHLFRENRSLKETYLGHFGRTARLIGLMLDRAVDYRRFFMNHLTASKVEFEFIQQLGEVIDAVDFDPSWNVEVARRFLEVQRLVDQQAGAMQSFIRMARFLGFSIWLSEGEIPFILSRRLFDSVIDPDRPDTPFDTDIFDSGADDEELIKILFAFFKESTRGIDGETSAPSIRHFISAGANFTLTAQAGSLLLIHDVDTGECNGQYLIESVVNDTTLQIDQDWPASPLTNLTYVVSWQVPCPDPYVDAILLRYQRFKARWQELLCEPAVPQQVEIEQVQFEQFDSAGAGVTELAGAFNAEPEDGNTLIAIIGLQSSGIEVTNVAQNGASWQRVARAEIAANGTNIEIWWARGDGVVGAEVDVEVLFSNFCISAVTLVEYSGILRLRSGLDQSAIFEDDVGDTIGQTGATPQTTQDHELWIGGIASVANPAMGAPSESFVQIGVTQDSGIMRMVCADRIVEEDGLAGFGLSLAPASSFVGAVATFKRR